MTQGPIGAAPRVRAALPTVTFEDAPLVVYWEATWACGLACRHCRAEAVLDRHPDELTTDEAEALLREVRAFGGPLLVITGGDPLERPDLFDLIRYGRGLGLRIAITPSVTPRLTPAIVGRFRDCGVETVALSLDGSRREAHDAFRAIPGCFEATLAAGRAVREAGMPLQVNTTVCAETVDDLPAIHRVVGEMGATRWSLFFLVPVGRGRALREVTPGRCERVLRWLSEIARSSPFAIKTTEAHHYRRVLFERLRREGRSPEEILHGPWARGFGVSDGNGVVFVSWRGEVYPSGFLPLSAGNVRATSLVEIYRRSPLLRALRDRTRLRGRCGRCPYRGICGGSRARACAVTGDPLESDPLCAFQPPPMD